MRTVKDRFNDLVDEITYENNRQQMRIDDYYKLVYEIDKLCCDSKSKLSESIQKLIDKHYEL